MSASQAPESPPPPGWEKHRPSFPPRSPSPPPTCPNPPENPDSAPRSPPPHRPQKPGCSPPKKPGTPPLQPLEEGVESAEPSSSRMRGCEGAGCEHVEQPGAPFLPSAKENVDSSGQGRSISPPLPPSRRKREGDIEVGEPSCSPSCSKREEASCGARSQNRETETLICPRESNSPGRERQRTPTRVSSPKKLKTSPQLSQTLPPPPPPPPPSQEMGQMVCGSCDELLSYPKNALLVKCPCCEMVNFVLEEHQVGNVKCGRCSVLLMYPYGSPSVRCSCCRFVTKILAHNERPPLSVQRGHPRPPSTPY